MTHDPAPEDWQSYVRVAMHAAGRDVPEADIAAVAEGLRQHAELVAPLVELWHRAGDIETPIQDQWL